MLDFILLLAMTVFLWRIDSKLGKLLKVNINGAA